MNYCSLEFIFIFLPLFLIAHTFAPTKFKNTVLLVGSFVFYYFAVSLNSAYDDRDAVICLLLLGIAILINFALGLLIENTDGVARKLCLAAGVLLNSLSLLFFKYAGALSAAFAALLPSSFAPLSLIFPLGLSYYIFKCISYLTEVYTGKVRAERNVIDLGAYFSLFPQISVGPIQTYADFLPYLRSRKITLPMINDGLYDFIIGLGLNIIISTRLGFIWTEPPYGIETIGYEFISTPYAWLGIIAFSVQLFIEAYGYSLMAIGLGKMLGYVTPPDFDYPYVSLSVSEFWRRWRMSLGGWFKENIYFPLGGSRVSTLRVLFNMLAVWIATGIWHTDGGNLKYIFWGLFLFFFAALERLGVLSFITKNKVLGHIYTPFVIIMSWVIFKLPSLSAIKTYFLRLFPIFGSSEFVIPTDFLSPLARVGVWLVLGILFCTPLPRKIFEKIRKYPVLSIPIMLAIFWYSIYMVACGANNNSLYSNF